MGPSAWNGDKLTLYQTTQWLMGMKSVISKPVGMSPEQVHVVSPFVRGGFGCKGLVWPHSVITAAAAREVKGPVKLVLRPQEMFSNVGHRGRTPTWNSTASACGDLEKSGLRGAARR